MEEYVAHIRNNSEIQLVSEHCKNVAEIAYKEAKDIGIGNILYVVGILHDIGKSTQVFKEYLQKASEGDKSIRKGEVNHSSAGARYIKEYQDNVQKNSIVELVAETIAYAIFSHHGMENMLSIDGKDYYEKRIYPKREIYYEEAVANSKEFISKSIEEYYKNTITEFEEKRNQIKEITIDMYNKSRQNQENGITDKTLDKGQISNFLLGGLQRLILSILVDADRLDTAEFMTGEKEIRLSKNKLKNKWLEYLNRLEVRLLKYNNDSDICKIRTEMSDLCADFANNGDGIYRLAIPTGGGKTLSSLRYALELAIKTEKKHIFYIAPFLSILEQNAEEIRLILQDEDFILEHHSNVVIENDECGEEYRKHEIYAESWSSPIIMTTMVQFLNTLFSAKMQSVRRFHQLKDSVIIIDEAQAIPVKCINLFTVMMNFLNKCCNTTIILCTATQPLFEKTKCPILFKTNSDILKNSNYYYNCMKRVKIVDKTETKLNTEELVDFCLSNFNHNMLIILNTKQAVQEVYDAVKKHIQEEKSNIDDEILVIQLTTYMCAAHRLDKIKEMKDRLGKCKVICISTQLIEAGVDISFETVVRSLSGLDSIMQAAGRCNRNGEKDIGIVYIIDYERENTGQLKDIEIAKNSTRTVLAENYDDLLSDIAMKRFYKQYYWNRRNEMDYYVHKYETTLFELLSNNRLSKNEYKNTNKKEYPYIMGQAFKTAGDEFSVIDGKDMVGIIVPYKDAGEDIKILRKGDRYADYKKILKRLQRYTINLYSNDKRVIDLISRNQIVYIENIGIYVLDDGLYDEEKGITTELKNLIF